MQEQAAGCLLILCTGSDKNERGRDESEREGIFFVYFVFIKYVNG